MWPRVQASTIDSAQKKGKLFSWPEILVPDLRYRRDIGTRLLKEISPHTYMGMPPIWQVYLGLTLVVGSN